ncbi:(-)-germacrene D synthase-like [Telopea speciosissima]|uniref:(-)-germacrene D synthase-like n=1 Tax=Telopea speciosissima TaxID=54955 RepID=UPI001CC3A5B1|nr:(-)-germacrene D synthase-like [Telopea speciosissima]
MSLQSSFVATPNANTKIIRPLANFHPSIWGDRFITYAPPDDMMYEACLKQVDELKEEVRRMLVGDANNEFLKKLSLIDSLQRLGVAYHFEEEIEEILEQIHEAPDHGFDDDNDDLYTIALRFRLLRQQGYNVPCDVFKRFKEEDFINDVSGMLCLYEATHLRVHGEDILDEALEFTTTRLNSIVTDGLKPHPLATQVMHALKKSFHKNPPRIEARDYISIYQEDYNTKNESLLKLAKLDFNLLQSIHQQELSQLSKWWKELGFASKLPYARNRLVESYFVAMGLCFEPHYALSRKMITKVTSLIVIIDDTYDAYGTFEELQLFTDAVERWDYSAMDGLPEYMKVIYSALLDFYNETEEELRKDGQSYRFYYAKEAMQTQVRTYFIEAKWLNDGYIPTFEVYMQNASTSIAYILLVVHSLVGMGDFVTKETFAWAMNNPELMKASTLIARLMNDMKAHKFEQERGHVCSAVECYMKQHNVSEEEVYDEFNRRVVDAWKDVNEACMRPMMTTAAIPRPVLSVFVNYDCNIDVVYTYKDGFTFANEILKELITSLLVDPIPM